MELKELTEKSVEMFGAGDAAELPGRVYDAVRNNDTEKYDRFCEIVENDLSVDWM